MNQSLLGSDHFAQEPDPAAAVARALLDAGCVRVRSEEPFRLPSGWASPVYIDCRRLISFPTLRRRLLAHGLHVLRTAGVLDGLAAVVGGEASGIAFAAWVADALDLPLHYVRKHRTVRSQVEGVVEPGARVLLIDDMMAGGQSKVRFCKALETAGARVDTLFVLFDYATFPTQELLAPLGVTVHSLATWQDVCRVWQARGGIETSALRDFQAFLSDPARWSQAHGGVARNPVKR
ncbi:MAG TPA: phosphoribosyltransferase family protein [Castellaniella sp.]|uniref:orotate phosphoribosyltransferase n=1 Tax=Castellaniella sp. TaxID=1955812 RepID=UPI002F1268D3